MASARRRPSRVRLAIALGALVLLPPPAAGTPLDFLRVGDPVESELRILDLLDTRPLEPRIRLPHLGIRPLQPIEILGPGAPPESLGLARTISVVRIERALERDADSSFVRVPGRTSTPRLYAALVPGEQRFEASVGLAGALDADDDVTRVRSGSGLHGRFAAEIANWLAHAHVTIAQIDHARSFADPVVANHDVIVYTDETYLAYTAERAVWSAQFGRSRWHWGPGEQASLVLSGTSAPLTAFVFRIRAAPLRADAIALSATLAQTRGEQLAAHRLEWQPHERLRLGLTEAARYRGNGWQPLYVVGAIPYILVQRLQVEDERDSLDALRNNILVGVDAAWRIADGTRVYGEWLVDDLHARTASIPNKVAWQLGWEGVGTIGARRLTWGGELTRLTRYVYTSFFGRAYEAQGRPLGFPTGPDARRIRLRFACDPSPDWQLGAIVTQTDKGENDLDEPFVPGSPRVHSSRFEGVVERTREAELGVRWWPAGGVAARLAGGWRWTENAGHVGGRDEDGPRGSFELTLVR